MQYEQVMGDNVMLAVATSDILVGPTRLLYPRPTGGEGEASFFPFALLGEVCHPLAPELLRPASFRLRCCVRSSRLVCSLSLKHSWHTGEVNSTRHP